MDKVSKIGVEVDMTNLEELSDTVDRVSSALSDVTPQVVIRGARNCTFNIYPSNTKVYDINAGRPATLEAIEWPEDWDDDDWDGDDDERD